MAKKIFTLIAVILLFSSFGVIARDFIDNGDGTVTDENTGLMWQQGEAGSMNWEDAITCCEGLSLAGYTDWRLPNIKELRSITEDTEYFPDAHESNYWSSTTFAKDSSSAWVDSKGNVGHGSKPSTYYVRCVRGGQ